MKNDLIVTEVRRVREELARRLDYDIHAIFADLRSREACADPLHPLVRDACEGEFIEERLSTVREEPPLGGRKKD